MAGINLNKLIADTARRLREVGIDSGEAEAELILCDILDVDRLHLYLHGPSILNEDDLKKYEQIVAKRLTRYPLQYILGSAWFFGRKFTVNEDVMVPCPETELLLDSVLRGARHCASDPVKLLDIGTGSGVVAISARLENPTLAVTASDISPKALIVAKNNAEKFEVGQTIRFVQSDLFASFDQGERFDIIASNPPYIAEPDYADLPPEVLADPKISLTSGPKGLDIIRQLIRTAPDYLERPGHLMFEIGYDQAETIFDLVDSDNRYVDCSLFKDMSDIDRVVVCRVG